MDLVAIFKVVAVLLLMLSFRNRRLLPKKSLRKGVVLTFDALVLPLALPNVEAARNVCRALRCFTFHERHGGLAKLLRYSYPLAV